MTSSGSFLYSQKTSNIVWGAFLIAMIIGILAPRSLAYLPGAIALTLTGLTFLKHKKLPKFSKREFSLFVSLILLAFASSLWSVNSDFSNERSVKLAFIFLGGYLLINTARALRPPETKLSVTNIIGLTAIFAVFLISQEHTDHFLIEFILDEERPIHQLNRSFVVFAFLSLLSLFVLKTSSLVLKNKIVFSVFLLLLCGYALCLSESETSQLCFLCGLFFLYLWPAKCPKMGRLFFAALVILCLSLPSLIKPLKNTVPEEALLSGILKSASIVHRFEVWEYTTDKIQNGPIYGYGIDSQRFMKSDKWMPHQQGDTILHAHNIILQIWIEFGILGIILGVAFLVYFYHRIYYEEENIEFRRLKMMIFATAFCCAMTGYGVWQSWQVGLFLFLPALVIIVEHHLNHLGIKNQ